MRLRNYLDDGYLIDRCGKIREKKYTYLVKKMHRAFQNKKEKIICVIIQKSNRKSCFHHRKAFLVGSMVSSDSQKRSIPLRDAVNEAINAELVHSDPLL